MSILALDLGRLTGWAYRVVPQGCIVHGQQDFSEAYQLGYGSLIWAFEKWLKGLIIDLEPSLDLLAFEQVHHRGGISTRIAYGQWAIVQKLAFLWPCKLLSVHSATLKKFATGNGRAVKTSMQTFASERLGLRGDLTEDEVDAAWVLVWAEAQPRHIEEQLDKMVDMVRKA